ncbi:MAG: FHA domain-containing protein [Acidobacteria bacterium]|nr:FHA domain-containing protein [Acidobacteriota bacterium]
MSGGWRDKLKAFVGRLDENYEADEKTAARGGSRWNQLLDSIAREIERVMRAELLQPPGEPAYIPPEYLVFLSVEDERELRGDRRLGFMRGLRHATAEAAGRLVGGQAQTERLFVQVKADGSLTTDEFAVKALWDVEYEATQVAARGRGTSSTRSADSTDEETQVAKTPASPHHPIRWLILVDQGDASTSHEHAVRTPHFTIGRGGKQVSVDLELPDDPEISRLHLTLHGSADRGLVVEVSGRNPVRIGDDEVQPGGQHAWAPDAVLSIGKYRLRLKSAPMLTQSR